MSKQNLQNGRPPVPDWIREFSCRGWTNVFRHLPDEVHLYGTETLFGDWSSRVLLLAKDWGPTSELERALREGDSRPWSHSETGKGSRTNNRLIRLVTIISEENLLYGSATANMLYNDDQWSRELKGFKSESMQEFLQGVLRWVLLSMPRIQAVACLGAEAWYLTCNTIGNSPQARLFKKHRDSSLPIRGFISGKGVQAFALYHPAARVSNESLEKGWHALAASLPSPAPRARSRDVIEELIANVN